MFKAGVAKVKITPLLGIELWGYGFYLNRYAKEANDDLYARAIGFRGYAGCMVPMITGFFHFKKNVGETLIKKIKKLWSKINKPTENLNYMKE